MKVSYTCTIYLFALNTNCLRVHYLFSEESLLKLTPFTYNNSFRHYHIEYFSFAYKIVLLCLQVLGAYERVVIWVAYMFIFFLNVTFSAAPYWLL